MIKYLKKDLTDVIDGVVIHGCNCAGGFGSGVAGAVAKKWPEMKDLYHNTRKPLLGEVYYVRVTGSLIVGNAYTQLAYGYDGARYANMEAIEVAVKNAIDTAYIEGTDLYMPKIGAGYGGLSWAEEVYPMLNELDTRGITINVCII